MKKMIFVMIAIMAIVTVAQASSDTIVVKTGEYVHLIYRSGDNVSGRFFAIKGADDHGLFVYSFFDESGKQIKDYNLLNIDKLPEEASNLVYSGVNGFYSSRENTLTAENKFLRKNLHYECVGIFALAILASIMAIIATILFIKLRNR